MYRVPAVLPLLLLSLYSCELRAQTTNASITGLGTDPSRATVPDAKVAAVNLRTNFRYESSTNGAGEFALANRTVMQMFQTAACARVPARTRFAQLSVPGHSLRCNLSAPPPALRVFATGVASSTQTVL
jgi:hypothetical protein